MALVTHIERLRMERNSVHGEVRCTVSVFSADNGQRYIQLDTYGAPTRKIKGKKSQSIQLSESSAKELAEILHTEGFA